VISKFFSVKCGKCFWKFKKKTKKQVPLTMFLGKFLKENHQNSELIFAPKNIKITSSKTAAPPKKGKEPQKRNNNKRGPKKSP
jgi:hypothetical protein